MNRFLIRVGLEHFALGLVLPINIIWKLQNGLSLPEVALTESIILVVTVIAEIPAGYFADKFSNRHSLGVGSIAHFLALSITLYADSILSFTIASLFFGLGWAFISGADEAHIHDDYPEGRKNFQTRVSKMHIADEVGTIGGMMTSTIIAYLSRDTQGNQFIIASIIMSFVALYSFVVLPTKSVISHDKGEKQINIYKQFIKSIKKYWIVFLLLGVIYEYGRYLWQPKLESSGINIADFGLYYAFFKLSSILGSYIASKSRLSRSYIIGFFALTILALLAIATTNRYIIVMGLLTLLFSENFLRVWQSVILSKMSGEKRATFLSSASLSRNLTGAIIIFMLGFPAQKSIATAIMVLVLLKMITGILVIRKHNFSIGFFDETGSAKL